MLFVLHRFALSSSRPGLARVKGGRNWVCKTSSSNIVRKKPKRLLNNRRQSNKRDVVNGKLKERIARLRLDMAEISVEQKSIAEGHKQVRKKTEEIHREHELLRKETEILSQKNNGIRERLNLMFQILKARVESDSAKVAQLTRSLRDLMIAKPYPK